MKKNLLNLYGLFRKKELPIEQKPLTYKVVTKKYDILCRYESLDEMLIILDLGQYEPLVIDYLNRHQIAETPNFIIAVDTLEIEPQFKLLRSMARELSVFYNPDNKQLPTVIEGLEVKEEVKEKEPVPAVSKEEEEVKEEEKTEPIEVIKIEHHKGIWVQPNGVFRARIKVGNHKFPLGTFNNQIDAINRYREAEEHERNHTFSQYYANLMHTIPMYSGSRNKIIRILRACGVNIPNDPNLFQAPPTEQEPAAEAPPTEQQAELTPEVENATTVLEALEIRRQRQANRPKFGILANELAAKKSNRTTENTKINLLHCGFTADVFDHESFDFVDLNLYFIKDAINRVVLEYRDDKRPKGGQGDPKGYQKQNDLFSVQVGHGSHPKNSSVKLGCYENEIVARVVYLVGVLHKKCGTLLAFSNVVSGIDWLKEITNKSTLIINSNVAQQTAVAEQQPIGVQTNQRTANNAVANATDDEEQAVIEDSEIHLNDIASVSKEETIIITPRQVPEVNPANLILKEYNSLTRDEILFIINSMFAKYNDGQKITDPIERNFLTKIFASHVEWSALSKNVKPADAIEIHHPLNPLQSGYFSIASKIGAIPFNYMECLHHRFCPLLSKVNFAAELAKLDFRCQELTTQRQIHSTDIDKTVYDAISKELHNYQRMIQFLTPISEFNVPLYYSNVERLYYFLTYAIRYNVKYLNRQEYHLDIQSVKFTNTNDFFSYSAMDRLVKIMGTNIFYLTNSTMNEYFQNHSVMQFRVDDEGNPLTQA